MWGISLVWALFFFFFFFNKTLKGKILAAKVTFPHLSPLPLSAGKPPQFCIWGEETSWSCDYMKSWKGSYLLLHGVGHFKHICIHSAVLSQTRLHSTRCVSDTGIRHWSCRRVGPGGAQVPGQHLARDAAGGRACGPGNRAFSRRRLPLSFPGRCEQGRIQSEAFWLPAQTQKRALWTAYGKWKTTDISFG